MLKLQVQTFQVPRWVVPVMILIALALIPFALVLGLALTAVAVGFSALRLFLPSPGQPTMNHPSTSNTRLRNFHSDSTVIDADYEIKDENGKS